LLKGVEAEPPATKWIKRRAGAEEAEVNKRARRQLKVQTRRHRADQRRKIGLWSHITPQKLAASKFRTLPPPEQLC
jgi:hypothetical protein